MLNRLSGLLSSFTPGTSSSKDLLYNIDDEEFCVGYPWGVSRGTRKVMRFILLGFRPNLPFFSRSTTLKVYRV
jgi:hypothetical protein